MAWAAPLVVTIGLLFALLGVGLEIGLALAVVGILALLLFGPGLQPEIIGLITWNTLASFVLTTIPLFLFIGELLQRSGLTIPFYRAIALWLRRTPGGLLHANIVACSLFAAVSGTSTATAATIGTVAIPEMRRKKYDTKMTLGSLAAGGTLGILIPPSVPMIIYGSVTDLSVGRLFVAGVVPGLILTVLFMLYIACSSLLRGQVSTPVAEELVSWRMRARTLLEVLPMFSLVLVILGGIYSGVTTPTEAAGIGAFAAILLTLWYRKFSWGLLRESLEGTVRTTCMILLIMVGAQILQYGFVYTGMSRGLVEWLLSLSAHRLVIFVGLCVIYLILGCIMDGLSMMLLTLPVAVPAIIGLGYDPIWFGIVLVVLIEVSLITPPVGLNLFVIQGISGRPILEISQGSMPYFFLMWVLIALLTVFPEVALFLPSRMLGP